MLPRWLDDLIEFLAITGTWALFIGVVFGIPYLIHR